MKIGNESSFDQKRFTEAFLRPTTVDDSVILKNYLSFGDKRACETPQKIL